MSLGYQYTFNPTAAIAAAATTAAPPPGTRVQPSPSPQIVLRPDFSSQSALAANLYQPIPGRSTPPLIETIKLPRQMASDGWLTTLLTAAQAAARPFGYGSTVNTNLLPPPIPELDQGWLTVFLTAAQAAARPFGYGSVLEARYPSTRQPAQPSWPTVLISERPLVFGSALETRRQEARPDLKQGWLTTLLTEVAVAERNSAYGSSLNTNLLPLGQPIPGSGWLTVLLTAAQAAARPFGYGSVLETRPQEVSRPRPSNWPSVLISERPLSFGTALVSGKETPRLLLPTTWPTTLREAIVVVRTHAYGSTVTGAPTRLAIAINHTRISGLLLIEMIIGPIHLQHLSAKNVEYTNRRMQFSGKNVEYQGKAPPGLSGKNRPD